MRRTSLLLASAVLLGLAVAPQQALAGRSMKKQILVPTAALGVRDTSACPGPKCQKQVITRHQRCAYLADAKTAQDARAGKFGYTIKLTPAERDGLHSFRLTDATGQAPARDFDIVFYRSLGSCSGPPLGSSVQPADPPTFAAFGADRGRIPRGMRYAIVALFAGPPGTFRFSTTP